jgi:hypothetical protein
MSWYDVDFKRRMPIAIDTSLTSSGSFQFALTIPSSWDDFWDNVLTNGYDAVITDENGDNVATFERVTWNVSTRTGTFRCNFGTVKAANVIHQGWLYWDNPSASSDLSVSVAISSPVNAYIYLGAPFKNVVNLASQSGLSTVPTTIIQKDPDELIDVWFPVAQLLAPRSLPSEEKLDFKLVNYYDFEVLDSAGSTVAMVSLGETRSINGWVRTRITGGTADTDYVIRCIVQNTDLEKFILSSLLQVRKLLPT